MRHIGILGGSFNPIHLGHLFIGRAAAEAFCLDSVLLLPSNVSPFKCGLPCLASGDDRLEMVRLSVAGDPLFEPCAIDLERGGVSYAIETVKALREKQPLDRFSFFITVERPGIDGAVTSEALAFPPEVRERLLLGVIRGRPCDISSSEIRRRIAEGKSIRYLVCPAVEVYIRSRGLYAATKEG